MHRLSVTLVKGYVASPANIFYFLVILISWLDLRYHQKGFQGRIEHSSPNSLCRVLALSQGNTYLIMNLFCFVLLWGLVVLVFWGFFGGCYFVATPLKPAQIRIVVLTLITYLIILHFLHA